MTKDEMTEENEVQIPEKFKSLVETVEKLTIVDLAELVKILEKKFGVSSAAPVAITAALASPEAGAGEEEKTSFTVVLAGVGDKKIEVIKAVRDATSKGLKEAKDLVDAAASGPQVIAENIKKEDAEELKKKFTTAGAKVELK